MIAGALRRRYLPEQAAVYTHEGQGRAGGARGDPPDLARARPRGIARAPEPRAYRLYELIWKRFVASQMAAALFDSTTVDIGAGRASAPGRECGGALHFRATGSVLKFPGFLAVYTRARRGRGRRGQGARCRRWPRRAAGPDQAARPAALHPAAAALHRGQPGQRAGGAGIGRPIDLRADDLHHLRPRLCRGGGEAAVPDRPRQGRQRHPGRALPGDFRHRLHLPDGGAVGRYRRASASGCRCCRPFYGPFAARS